MQNGSSSGSDFTAIHQAMIDGLVERGFIRSQAVKRAFETVPRHLFLPDVALEKVYSGQAIITQYGSDGLPTSSSSEPAIMATMIEQLRLEHGHRVLEIGTGTGYNAALLAHLVGKEGSVTTVDMDEDLVRRAEVNLKTAGFGQVCALTGDGWLGAPGLGAFDMIEVTVGVWDLSPHWIEQLRSGGILLAPLWLRGGLQVSVALQKHGRCFRSLSSAPCGFMLLRGPHAGPRTHLTIEKWVASLEGATDVDLARLRRLLNLPPRSYPVPPTTRAVFNRLLLEEPGAISLQHISDFSHLMAGLYDSVEESLAVVEAYLSKQAPPGRSLGVRSRRLLVFGTDTALLRLRDCLATLLPLELSALRIEAIPVCATPSATTGLVLRRRDFKFLIS